MSTIDRFNAGFHWNGASFIQNPKKNGIWVSPKDNNITQKIEINKIYGLFTKLNTIEDFVNSIRLIPNRINEVVILKTLPKDNEFKELILGQTNKIVCIYTTRLSSNILSHATVFFIDVVRKKVYLLPDSLCYSEKKTFLKIIPGDYKVVIPAVSLYIPYSNFQDDGASCSYIAWQWITKLQNSEILSSIFLEVPNIDKLPQEIEYTLDKNFKFSLSVIEDSKDYEYYIFSSAPIKISQNRVPVIANQLLLKYLHGKNLTKFSTGYKENLGKEIKRGNFLKWFNYEFPKTDDDKFAIISRMTKKEYPKLYYKKSSLIRANILYELALALKNKSSKRLLEICAEAFALLGTVPSSNLFMEYNKLLRHKTNIDNFILNVIEESCKLYGVDLAVIGAIQLNRKDLLKFILSNNKLDLEHIENIYIWGTHNQNFEFMELIHSFIIDPQAQNIKAHNIMQMLKYGFNYNIEEAVNLIDKFKDLKFSSLNAIYIFRNLMEVDSIKAIKILCNFAKEIMFNSSEINEIIILYLSLKDKDLDADIVSIIKKNLDKLGINYIEYLQQLELLIEESAQNNTKLSDNYEIFKIRLELLSHY